MWNFEPIRNFAHNTGFSTLGKALLTLYFQILIIQRSNQRGKHQYRKVMQLKKTTLKNESEDLKP